jgi:3',5'-cyclic AMP phosphodiesterase CpdA
MLVVGLNSARTIPFSGDGRLNQRQVDRAAALLATAATQTVKIVVTHHPFDLPHGHDEEHLIGRAGMAMEKLAAVGADLFLAGHLHVSHVGRTAERYRIARHSALVVQAGTMSTRERGEVNSFNVLRLAHPRITIERYTWIEEQLTFVPAWTGTFQHTPDGWL